MKQKTQFDYSISLIRLIATSFIITCHIMQYLNIELAWWFNVGVQIFLCMSGFLYGQKDIIKNDWQFYTRNAKKILIDYYIVIFFALILFSVFFPEQLSTSTIIYVLTTKHTLRGGEHLWYIPYCLFCYLITPILSRVFGNSNDKKTLWRFFAISLFTFFSTENFIDFFNSAWIMCYITGFFLGVISKSQNIKFYKQISAMIIGTAVLFNSIQITLDYIIKFEFNGAASLYAKYCNYSHVLLGVALFIILKAIFSAVFKNRYPEPIQKVCFYSDKYSYDIYLVHQFLILGPFSLMGLTKSLAVNIVLIILLTLVCAIGINCISYCINSSKQLLQKKIN